MENKQSQEDAKREVYLRVLTGVKSIQGKIDWNLNFICSRDGTSLEA